MGIEKPQKRTTEESKKSDGENLGDYQALLDNTIIDGAKKDISLRKEALDNKHIAIQEDSSVVTYFEKESKLPSIEEEIRHLATQIEAAMEEGSHVSKEELEEMISDLRGHERTLKNHKEDLRLRRVNDMNVKVAILKLEDLEKKIQGLDNTMSKIVEEYKKRNDDNDPWKSPTFSLN